jgi:hypothetical protein
MDVPMPRMSTSLVGRSHKNTFLWLDKNPQESETRRTPVQPQYRIPDAPDISLNDVSFTSMTVHMETVYADKNVTSSTFPGTT